MEPPDRTVPLSRPDIGDAERAAVLAVLQTPYLSLGPKVAEFETQLARYVGVKHAVAVNSGTSGLHLCVKAAGLKPGDEVITSPFSFVASANCLLYEDAVPVFVDIDPVSLNLDVDAIEGKITPRTKGILPVHVFGQPCDMDAIHAIAHRHGLVVIEDACEAIGASYRGRMAGGLGDCGVIAFYPNKQMTTGEGGAIVTDRDDLAALCRSLRNQGRDEGDAWLAHVRLGYNYRLSDIHCALGIAQLNRIDELLERRSRVADVYARYLAQVPGVTPLASIEDTQRSWFVYVVLLEDDVPGAVRDALLQRLRGKGIGCSNYFPPLHLQPFLARRLGHQAGDFPVTESVSSRTVALPFYASLSEADIRLVVETFALELDVARSATDR
jgi:perosamine synthetase